MEKRHTFYGTPSFYMDPRVTQEQKLELLEDIERGLSYPQRKSVGLVTGENQYPSEALGIGNNIGAFLTDAIADPINFIPASLLGRAARLRKISKPQKGADPVRQAKDVVSEFNVRLHSPEGRKRALDLGFKPENLGAIDVVPNPNTFGHISGDAARVQQGILSGNITRRPGLHSMNVNPEPTPLARNVARHEIEHAVQSAVKNSYGNRLAGTPMQDFAEAIIKRQTPIDNVLADLPLKKTHDAIIPVNPRASTQRRMEHSMSKDHASARSYFEKGDPRASYTRAEEKSAFLAEAQQWMLDKGLLKHKTLKDGTVVYDEITPERVKKAYNAAKKDRAGRSLRIFNIMDEKDSKSFEVIAKGINMMVQHPGATMAVGTGAASAIGWRDYNKSIFEE